MAVHIYLTYLLSAPLQSPRSHWKTHFRARWHVPVIIKDSQSGSEQGQSRKWESISFLCSFSPPPVTPHPTPSHCTCSGSCLITNTYISSTPSHLRRDTAREDEHRTDRENRQLPPRFSAPSMTEHFFTPLFVPKSGNITSVGSALQAPPSETTPLLAPVDHKSPGSNTFVSVFRQETKTLVRYALPVFGFVYSASAYQRTFSLMPMSEVRIYSNIVSSCHQ